jgi:hypothetical protein
MVADLVQFVFGQVWFGQGWVQILMLVNCLMRDLHLGQLGGGVL